MEDITNYVTSRKKLYLVILRDTYAIQRACTLSGCSSPFNVAVEALLFYRRFNPNPKPIEKYHFVFPKNSSTIISKNPLHDPVEIISKPKSSPSPLKVFFRNAIFQDEQGEKTAFDDDHHFEDKEEDRASLFLLPVTRLEFHEWLQNRKQKWQKRYCLYQLSELVVPKERKGKGGSCIRLGSYTAYSNPLFCDDEGECVGFYDNEVPGDSDEETRNQLFSKQNEKLKLPCLMEGEEQWHTSGDEIMAEHLPEETERSTMDFWSPQGFPTFDTWLQSRIFKWRAEYSWNKKKRKRLEEDCNEIVTLSSHTFCKWLRVRKNQWSVERRKRHLLRQEEKLPAAKATALPPEVKTSEEVVNNVDAQPQQASMEGNNPLVSLQHSPSSRTKFACAQKGTHAFAVIDAFLEEREQKQKAAELRPPFDLMLLLNPLGGAPDDVVAHFMRFLEPVDRSRLLSLDRVARQHLIERGQVWRSLCSSKWNLPRRPRKPWHVFYFANLKSDVEQVKKRLDDLLATAAQLLFKGDQFQAIEKMVARAERLWDSFDINYSSGVVCEQNSLLNLAVIHKRHKVVRWLVETKNADIESRDRGGFTPLLNAAWAGDRFLVRFFMMKGADRTHVGTCHYTRPLAPPEFEGYTASGWAKHRGFDEIAKLIELGL